MNNGMTFGMEGPQITGWWVNPNTGDKFNAVDTFFEDNQLIIKTADGRMLRFDQIQNYVQAKAEDAERISANAKAQPKSDEIPAEVLKELDDTQSPGDIMIPEDNIFGVGGKKSSPLGNMNGPSASTPTVESSEMAIIQRALKNKPKPSVTGLINWTEFPKKEIVMLMEIMEVPFETIVDYYVNSVNINEIVENIKNDLTNYIKETLGVSVIGIEPQSEASGDAEKETKIAPKKTPKKK